MEITRKSMETHLELHVNGRLDAYWADHLGAALDDALRQGNDDIRLDMAEVAYMSSVGIRVLLRYYKEARRLQGSFTVCNPSPAVKSVLELAGLESLLMPAQAKAETTPTPSAPSSRRVEHAGVSFEVFDLNAGAEMTARLIGKPGLDVDFDSACCHTVRAGESVLAVGLGALGRDFDDCRSRFGEFIAAGGAAAHLPTDGTNVPDSLVATGALVPELQVLNGIACDGAFAKLARFETAAGNAPVALRALIDACLAFADAEAAAIAIIADTAGLVGAALRRSPAADRRFSFELPHVRDWLSFTPERAFARTLSLVAGVAARADVRGLGEFLRPLGGDAWPAGHFHAAAFSYQPLRKGRIDLGPTACALFESAMLQGVLHLLNDDRPIVGSGESELTRGACWIAPIRRVEATA